MIEMRYEIFAGIFLIAIFIESFQQEIACLSFWTLQMRIEYSKAGVCSTKLNVTVVHSANSSRASEDMEDLVFWAGGGKRRGPRAEKGVADCPGLLIYFSLFLPLSFSFQTSTSL